MSQYLEGSVKSDTAAGAIGEHLRVKTPGALVVATENDACLGTIEFPVLAAGAASVRLRNSPGTRKMVAAGIVAKGNTVYAAAGGKVAATGTVVEGIAYSAAGANNDILEVMPMLAADLVATGGITLPTVTFNGATTVNKIIMPDDLADGLSIVEGANKYITFTTSNGSEAITVAKATTFTGNVTLSGAVDLVFSGTNGQPEILLTDNLADALSIKGTHGDMIVFTTTDNAEAIALTARTTITDGVGSGTAKRIGGLSYALVAAGTAHTNSTDEAVLGAFTIPANTIKAGTLVKVRYQGIATATNSTDTLAVVLRCGPTTLIGQSLITHAAVDVANDDIFEGEFTLVARAAPGAAAACVGVGSFQTTGAAGTATRKGAYLASTNFATNGALLMEVTADWSVANVGNSCRLDILNVEII